MRYKTIHIIISLLVCSCSFTGKLTSQGIKYPSLKSPSVHSENYVYVNFDQGSTPCVLKGHVMMSRNYEIDILSEFKHYLLNRLRTTYKDVIETKNTVKDHQKNKASDPYIRVNLKCDVKKKIVGHAQMHGVLAEVEYVFNNTKVRFHPFAASYVHPPVFPLDLLCLSTAFLGCIITAPLSYPIFKETAFIGAHNIIYDINWQITEVLALLKKDREKSQKYLQSISSQLSYASWIRMRQFFISHQNGLVTMDSDPITSISIKVKDFNKDQLDSIGKTTNDLVKTNLISNKKLSSFFGFSKQQYAIPKDLKCEDPELPRMGCIISRCENKKWVYTCNES